MDGGARGAPELAVVAALVGVGSGDAGAGAARQRARAADGDGPQDARDVHRHSSLVDRPDICPSRRDAARCLAVAGYGPGVCYDPRAEAAQALAGELGWSAGTREEALAADVVACVTPGHGPVVGAADLHPGLHLNMLGADGPGKAEATIEAVVACELFCDEWAQASHGGELTGAVEARRVTRADVTDLGSVLAGEAGGRSGPDAVTLFDSTGLAIQDLAVAAAALEALRAGRIEAQTVAL